MMISFARISGTLLLPDGLGGAWTAWYVRFLASAPPFSLEQRWYD